MALASVERTPEFDLLSDDDVARLCFKAHAGAEFLDRKNPGWARRIDTTRLNMASAMSCILGQLYGDYDHGTIMLQVEDVVCYDKGFVTFNADYLRTDQEYKCLAVAWRAEIDTRIHPA